ncbi:MAG: PEP/pyruvate-binding domain-containing protein [Pelovirga sp.]
MTSNNDLIRWFADLNNDDVALVGGKNASLGEMIGTLKAEDIRVPDGFTTTSRSYRR